MKVVYFISIQILYIEANPIAWGLLLQCSFAGKSPFYKTYAVGEFKSFKMAMHYPTFSRTLAASSTLLIQVQLAK